MKWKIDKIESKTLESLNLHIEVICEFLKQYLIITKTCFRQFLIISARLASLQKFLEGKSDTYKQLQGVHFKVRVGVVANGPQILTKISFVIFCAETLQQFSPTPKGYYRVCFFNVVKFYTAAKIKQTRSFDNSANKIEIVIRVD